MDFKRSGSQPSGKGPTEYFTGAVRIDLLFEEPDPTRVRAAIKGAGPPPTVRSEDDDHTA